MKNSSDMFLAGVTSIEQTLFSMGFVRLSFHQHGPAIYIEYKRIDTVVEFLFGPPEWHVEMIVYIGDAKFTLADLLQIPPISKWYDENSALIEGGNNLESELLWYVALLKFSLPVIER